MFKEWMVKYRGTYNNAALEQQCFKMLKDNLESLITRITMHVRSLMDLQMKLNLGSEETFHLDD